MSRQVKGINFSDDVAEEKVREVTDANANPLIEESLKQKSKIRISTMIDADILDELKRRAHVESDGRYQTYLNQLLRASLFDSEHIDENKITEVVKNLVKASALKSRRT